MVPYAAAPALGTQRLDTYTFALELTTKINKHFPGDIKYESVIRCALPLTVKRQPDACKNRFLATNQLPSPLRTMIPMGPRPNTCNVEVRMMSDITLDSDLGEGPSKRGRKDSDCDAQPVWTRFSTPCRDLGSTKVNQRGDLGTNSDAGSPEPTPQAVSILLSTRKRAFEDSPTRQSAARRSARPSSELPASRSAQSYLRPDPNNCNKPPIRVPPRSPDWNRTEKFPYGQFHSCLDEMEKQSPTWSEAKSRAASPWLIQFARNDKRCDSVVGSPQRSAESRAMTEDDVKAWQREIQRNYQESLENKENVEMLEAEAWSDEE